MARTWRPLLLTVVSTTVVLMSASCSSDDTSTKPSINRHENLFDPTELVGMKIAVARDTAHTNGYDVQVQRLSDWPASRRKTLPGSALRQPDGTVVTFAVCPDDCRPEEDHLLYLVVTP